MFGLERCCKCGKIVWWGQQSRISFGSIHKECHAKSISEYLSTLSDEGMCMALSEISEMKKVYSSSQMDSIFKGYE